MGIRYIKRDPALYLNKLILEDMVVNPNRSFIERVDLFTRTFYDLQRGIDPVRIKKRGRRMIFCDKHGIKPLVKEMCASCYMNERRKGNPQKKQLK